MRRTIMTKIRWGILGSANIAISSVIPGIQQSETGVVTTIASRSLEKSRKVADQLEIPTAYGSYEALIQDPNIDCVYIPLPNHLHMEWTIRAAKAGKHVLCEKPLALSASEANTMIEACEKAGVLLVEAFMYRYHPRYELIQKILQSGELGEIRGMHAHFSFNNAQDVENIRYKKAWGGGSLYDVGVYPISAARLLLRREPQAVTVHAMFSDTHDQVDMMAAGLLEFSNGVALTFDCGMWAFGRNTLEVLGTKGRIEVPSAFVSHQNELDFFYVVTNEGRREVEVPLVNHYALQADAIGHHILSGHLLPYPAEDALLNMKVLDACLISAIERRRVVLS